MLVEEGDTVLETLGVTLGVAVGVTDDDLVGDSVGVLVVDGVGVEVEVAVGVPEVLAEAVTDGVLDAVAVILVDGVIDEDGDTEGVPVGLAEGDGDIAKYATGWTLGWAAGSTAISGTGTDDWAGMDPVAAKEMSSVPGGSAGGMSKADDEDASMSGSSVATPSGVEDSRRLLVLDATTSHS